MKFLMRLYGDGFPDDGTEQESPADDDEARTLREVKRVLDARERRRPPASTIDTITATAASAASSATTAGRRHDRMPVRGRRRFALPVGVGSGVVLVVALLLFLGDPTPVLQQEYVAGPPLAERASPTETSAQREEIAGAPGDDASQSDDADVSRRELASRPKIGADVIRREVASRPKIGADVSRRELATSSEIGAAGLSGADSGDRDDTSTKRRPIVASAAQPPATPTLARSATMIQPAAPDLAWDDSEEVREVYRELMQLELISPAGGQWRPVVADPLAAPVGVSPSYRLTRLE